MLQLAYFPAEWTRAKYFAVQILGQIDTHKIIVTCKEKRYEGGKRTYWLWTAVEKISQKKRKQKSLNVEKEKEENKTETTKLKTLFFFWNPAQ